MKIFKIILIAILLITCSGCSEGILVLARIHSLDSSEGKLEIDFTFKRHKYDEDCLVKEIGIYANDSLQYVLRTHNGGISKWKFPKIPEGFKIMYPSDKRKIHEFTKSNTLTFEFSGGNTKPAHGTWNYEPRFSSSKYRWMFDDDGNQKIRINCSYESWIGKDIIKINFDIGFGIDDQSFQLFSDSGKPIEFTVKAKRKGTNWVVLALNKDLKEGENLHLSFLSTNGDYYDTSLVVNKRTQIGIAGKYQEP